MPKVIKERNTSPPNLGSSFNSYDTAGFARHDYDATSIRFWVRFDGTLTELVNYDASDTPVLAYEGGSLTSTETVYSNNMKTAAFISGSAGLASRNAVATFGGTNNALSFGNGTAATQQAFSISLWFKKNRPQVTELTDNYFFAKGLAKSSATYDNSEYGALLQRASDKLVFYLADASSRSLQFIESSAGTGLMTSFDTWHHIAFTYDGTPGDNSNGNTANAGLKIYLDGALHSTVLGKVHAGSGYLGMERKSQRIYIGSNDGGVSGDADLIMAEMAVWQKELTSEQVKAIYYYTYDNSRVNSGYLNNPPRVLLRENDNKPGAYPTKFRFGDKDRSGKQAIHYEDLPVFFGNKIEDDFNEVPVGADDIIIRSRFFDSSKWLVSPGMTIRREYLQGSAGVVIADRAATFSGPSFLTSGRFIRTRNKIKNPTSVYFELIQGPYNVVPAYLGLTKGDPSDVLKVQISTSADFTTPTTKTIATYTPTTDLDSFYTTKANDVRGPRKIVRLGLSDFGTLADSDFYLRFIQETISDGSKRVWAISKIIIETANQSIRYPLLVNNGDRAGSKISDAIVATPHNRADLTGTGRSLKGVSDVNSGFKEFTQNVTPYDESNTIETTTDPFFNTGLDPEIYPGFSSPFRDKTKITFDLSPASQTTFGYNKKLAVSSSDASRFNSSSDGQQLMVYWNNTTRTWEKIGPPVTQNNIGLPIATSDTLVASMSVQCVGFGANAPMVTGSLIPAELSWNDTTTFPRNSLMANNKPITEFAFPFGGQYHANDNRYVLASELGITKPFLLEGCSLSYDAKFETPNLNAIPNTSGIPAGNQIHNSIWPLFCAFGKFGKERSDVQYNYNLRLITPTFFMLRQYEDRFDKTINYKITNTTDGAVHTRIIKTATSSIPGFYKLQSGSEELTRVSTGRELITFGQTRLFLTQSNFPLQTGTGPATYINVTGFTQTTDELIDAGLGSDRNIIFADNWMSSSHTAITESITMNFPCRNISQYPPSNILVMMTGANITNNLYNEGTVYTQKQNGSRNESNLKNSRAIVNGVASYNPSQDLFTVTNAIQHKTVLPEYHQAPTVETFDLNSPYVIFPGDKLIFGWQYPIGFYHGTLGNASRDDIAFYSMSLFGRSKLHLYGSLISENVEHHETVNQNLNSAAAYEHIIGDEKIIDQWNVPYRGELTGSYVDQVPYGGGILGESPNQWSRVGSSRIGISVFGRGFYASINELLRIGVSLEIATAVSQLVARTARHVNFRDQDRIYADRNNVEGPDSIGAETPYYDTTRPSTYGTVQGFATLGKVGSSFFPRKRTFYSFNMNHFGHYSDMLQQGKDTKFRPQTFAAAIKYPLESRPTVQSQSPVSIQFVRGESIDGPEQKEYTRKTPKQLLEFFDFQSSNISLAATSSIPFIDDNNPRNRIYTIEEFIAVPVF